MRALLPILTAIGAITAVNFCAADEKGETKLDKDIEIKRSVRELQRKLDAHFDVERALQAPLKDMLEFLGDRKDMPLRIEADAFAAVKRQAPDEVNVRLPRMPGVSADTVLRIVLNSVDAVYEIRERHIAIVPNKSDQGIVRSFPPVTVRHKQRVRETRDKLLKKLDVERRIQAPLQDVVEFLGDRRDFSWFFDQRAFQVKGRRNVENTMVVLHVSAGKTTEQVLCNALEQANATFEAGPGYIRIVPK